jgi:hypothetical protein
VQALAFFPSLAHGISTQHDCAACVARVVTGAMRLILRGVVRLVYSCDARNVATSDIRNEDEAYSSANHRWLVRRCLIKGPKSQQQQQQQQQ